VAKQPDSHRAKIDRAKTSQSMTAGTTSSRGSGSSAVDTYPSSKGSTEMMQDDRPPASEQMRTTDRNSRRAGDDPPASASPKIASAESSPAAGAQLSASQEATVREGSPVFSIGGPTSSAWRELALTHVAELRTMAAWIGSQSKEPGAKDILPDIYGHLDEARATAEGSAKKRLPTWLRSWVGGSDVERTMSNLDAAEADLLRLAPMPYLRGQMSSLLAHVRHHTPTGDPRRSQIEEIARQARTRELHDFERDTIVSAARGASSEARREVMRVRSFRNVLLVSAALLFIAAIGLGVLGALRPTAIPLCFNTGEKVVCPTRETPLSSDEVTDVDNVIDATTTAWDIPLVATIGLIAAAVAAAAALGGIRGTSTPYSLPVALAVLKLPTGALTALLGLLLMRGEFIPGLSALDFPAQILAWAVVFGYAQQLFTRLVDKQAHTVLDDVGGSLNRASTG